MRNDILTRVLCMAGLTLGVLQLPVQAGVDEEARFDTLWRQAQREPGSISFEAFGEMMQLARVLGRPASASTAARAVLAVRREVPGPLLRESGDMAYLAGDLRRALTRYRQYLQDAAPDAVASGVAARVARILIDYLDTPEEGFRFLEDTAVGFRHALELRRFDQWFLTRARDTRDYAALARRLVLLMQQKLPIAQEHAFFWYHMDWLMDEISAAQPPHYPAAAASRQLAGLVRGQPARAAAMRFLAEHLAFKAAATGKEADVLEKEFGQVSAAARAYVDAAPTAATVQDIMKVFAGGRQRFDQGDWNAQAAPKRDVFVYAFGKLPDADRLVLMDWTWQSMHERVATPEQWAELGARHPALFKSATATARLSFPTRAASPAVFKGMSAFLAGVPSSPAAAINALAAAGPGDFVPAARHLLRQESWHLLPADLWRVLHDILIPAFQAYERPEGQTLPADLPGATHYTLGREVFATSAWALLQPEFGRDYVTAAWTRSGATPDDKSRVAEVLRSLDWVAYDEAQRRMIFGPAYAEFGKWAEAVRQRQAAADKANTETPTEGTAAALKISETEVALLTTLEGEFRKAFDPGTAAPTQAPGDLERHLSEAMAAARGRNSAAYHAAARAAYALVREYDSARLPFGRGIVAFLLENRDGVDVIDLQTEFLADQLKRVTDPQARQLAAHWTMGAVFAGRRWNSGYRQLPQNDRDAALKINDTLAESLRVQIEGDRLWAPAFDWFRNTRLGQGWHEQERNIDVLKLMVEKKSLLRAGAPRFGHAGAVPSYQWLIRNEFQPLNTELPVDRALDDLFAEEVRQTRVVDMSFFSYSPDRDRKVSNAITEVFAGFESLPLGYAGGEALYDWGTFWSAQGRLWQADESVRNDALEKMATYFGKSRFDSMCDGRYLIQTLPKPDNPATRAAWFAALNAYRDRVAALPWRPHPARMDALGSLGAPGSLSEAEILTLERVLAETPAWTWPRGQHFETLGRMLPAALVAAGRAQDAFVYAPLLWKIARDTANDNYYRELTQVSGSLVEQGHVELGGALAITGLELMGSTLAENLRGGLQAVRSRSLAASGALIPVERADRRYPIFAAQAAYIEGKHDNAWEQYLAHRALAMSEMRDLDPAFSIWLVQRHTASADYQTADALVKELVQWMDSAPQAFDPETRASLLLAMADIAFVQQEYARARAQFERIALNDGLNGTSGQREAELRMAEVDRLTRNFDRAVQQLDRLVRRRDPYMQAQGYYQLALINFDQEAYTEAREYLDQAFAVDPGHSLARILEGRLYLQMRKLVEATSVRAGLATDQQTLEPGRSLKIEIEDRTLSVVGTSAAVEIRVWAESGDEETFNLLPFGDSKTKFEGQLPTALGTPVHGDRVLQVLGGDVVRYDFSTRFKEANAITDSQSVVIRVVSDAELYVSSGDILTREEQDRQRLEAQLRARLQVEGSADAVVALSTLRKGNEIKPGNPVNVRVVDADRSVSTGLDRLSVRASTTSGDRVDRVELTETEPHSGVFEGRIPTASAPATAFASDSQEGSNPNFAITGADYPPWIALGDGHRPKIFSMDLNSSVALGEMTVTADVAGRRLRRFLVQTSPNGQSFMNAGAWPEALAPWDGSLRLEVARLAGATSAPATLGAFRDYLDAGHRAQRVAKVETPLSALALDWDASVGGHAKDLGLKDSGADSWFIGRVSGRFFQPHRQHRTFRLEHGDRLQNIRYFVTVDGAGTPGRPYEFSGLLDGGIHQIDVWFAAQRGAAPSWRLLCDSPEPPYMVPCPPAMFDTSSLDIEAAAFEPAIVTADANSERFSIAFAAGTRARVVRLWLLDFEGDAPAIRRVALSDIDGETLLPTGEDLLKLRQNETLEIIPGDRISVVYEDPSVVNKSRQLLEAQLTATFHDANIYACFVESVVDQHGNRQPRYVPMRRYLPGDSVSVFIYDPDEDVSSERDKVPFEARTASGERVTLEALESEAHSGVFIGRVFPVPGKAARAAEVTVQTGEDLILAYRDRENTNPGISWERRAVIEPVIQRTPQLHVYHTESRLLSEEERARVVKMAGTVRHREEVVPVTRSLAITSPERSVAGAPPPVGLHGVPVLFDLIYPTAVQSPESSVTVYVQTRTGRERHGLAPDAPFDLDVPGTIRLQRRPGGVGAIPPPAGYRDVVVRGNPRAGNPLDDGRFTFLVPIALGPLPERSFAHDQTDETAAASRTAVEDWNTAMFSLSMPHVTADGGLSWGGRQVTLPVLQVRGDDEVIIGFEWTHASGETQWLTERVSLQRDVRFDVMERRYQDSVESAYVGESLYLRLVDPAGDLSDKKDVLGVAVIAGSGEGRDVSLVETFDTSGVFKGMLRLVFAGDPERPEGDHVLPVVYGDDVTLTYDDPRGVLESVSRTVRIHRGADGVVLPFTKRFEDADIAVQTQFTIAEAYFEQAKKYRELEQEELARAVIAQGRRLLEEAIRDNPATEARAQAEYLLAELALEYAADTADETQRQRHHLEAIGRFTDLTALYPDSPYAPRAQYKKALTFEKMGLMEDAVGEYVKLSYRYPDNALVAETIARLGQYFLAKGREIQESAAAESDVVKRETILQQGRGMYRTAAEVFGRLAVRFPDHHLAGRTQVLAAQCYMRAEDLPRAIDVFEAIVNAREAEADLIAQSMYWAADCYTKSNNFIAAYRWFRRLTWDYPESQWAKYARGRLTEPQLVRAEETEGRDR